MRAALRSARRKENESMCGIVGKLRLDSRPVDRGEIERMANQLAHRGPDAFGIHLSGPVGLGQRRLAVIDLRPESTPPLTNGDKTIWVVFNGEIYNFRELRDDLVARGHVFNTATDTEVIIHAYEEFGPQCVQKFRGMFAIALWDARSEELFLARDRFGKKPMFYAFTPNAIVFASELQALLAEQTITREPNYFAIDQYLINQYVPSPLTAFRGIDKLEPGSFMICTSRGSPLATRYWTPPEPNTSNASNVSLAEFANELKGQVMDAVRVRLTSDVPLGAFLSGGIDSGCIVACMAQISSEPIRTFSIGFEEEAFNELPYARQVADLYSTRHEEFIVRPSAAQILPTLVRHYGEPFADSSAIPSYYVAQVARQQVTVAISGDGGDELFGGYERYEAVAKWARLDFVPIALRRAVFGRACDALIRARPLGYTERFAKGLRMLAENLPGRYSHYMAIFKESERWRLCTNQFRLLTAASRTELPLFPSFSEGATESLSWMMRHDQRWYLGDCLLAKTDIASMAHGLEVRSPLLDQDLATFAATIPAVHKRRDGTGKVLLRRAFADMLPPAILSKPKTGFAIPLARWLRGELRPIVLELLSESAVRRRGLFDFHTVSSMVNDHMSGQRDYSNRIWSLVFLEAWFREFFCE